MGKIKQKFRQIKKLPTWIFWFPAMLMKISFKIFFRYRINDPHHILDDPQRLIGITWHNRLMYLCPALPEKVLKNTSAVISASRDGQYLADFISFFGAQALRGSSSRKGANALLGAIRAIESGRNVAFTPDGPRGPMYKIKVGPVVVASKTGGVIVPFVINSSRCWKIKSWDKFQIPKPFSSLTMEIGAPISVPADADEETLEKIRMQAENALTAITRDPE
ncbi:MAG: DUF374 domain-containing protein [Lentisphaerae bacterium]|nr:DUF374 domain-containing protein [Lentisphaerota bacterium]